MLAVATACLRRVAVDGGGYLSLEQALPEKPHLPDLVWLASDLLEASDALSLPGADVGQLSTRLVAALHTVGEQQDLATVAASYKISVRTTGSDECLDLGFAAARWSHTRPGHSILVHT